MKKLFCCILAFSCYVQAQVSYSGETARRSEPWVKDGIIYEIYPRAFSKEGNFAGIEKRLPELKKLGVTILWLMPIHPIGIEKRKGTLGSSYSVKDYYGINPEYGTLNDFKTLVHAVHNQGMKIIIDMVANHTAWDNEMAKNHTRWYTRNELGMIVPPIADWSDVADLDYENPELRRYMIDMLKYWVRDIGIDGYRCDVAEMVPIDFWNEARAALDSIKPIIMLAEGQLPEEHLKAFDLTYSWNFYNRMSEIIKGTRHASSLDSLLKEEAAQFPKGSLRMLFSSNHDENAWDNSDVVKYGKEGAKLAAVLVSTYPGVPLLYNGQEVGSDQKLGLFDKFEINWNQGKDFFEFYTKLFAIRKQHPALEEGTYAIVKNKHPEKVYTFLRKKGNDVVLAAFNFASGERTVELTLPKNLQKKKFLNLFTGKKVDKKNVQKLALPAHGYRVFVVE